MPLVIATANDVTALPPELLRKGRFDELWFIDLPNRLERAQIMESTMRTNRRLPSLIDCGVVAESAACIDNLLVDSNLSVLSKAATDHVPETTFLILGRAQQPS